MLRTGLTGFGVRVKVAATAVVIALSAQASPQATHPPTTWTAGEYYFRVNGASTLTLSTNPFGLTGADYTPLFQQAAANGEKVVRIHVGSFYNFDYTIDPTTGLPIYDAGWIADWEAVFADAEAHGLYVLPVLDAWGNWNTVMPGWSYNFFNAYSISYNCVTLVSECGPAVTPSELLVAGSVTQIRWLDLMAHLVTQWRDQDNIIGWEIFSEVDNIEGYDRFAGCPIVDEFTDPCTVVMLVEAAADRIDDLDSRPITASAKDVNDLPALSSSPFIDWLQIHPYAELVAGYEGNLDRLILDTVPVRRSLYQKPVLIGESGLDTLFSRDKVNALSLKPRAWVGINQAIWAGAVSGAMNARALWVEDGYDYTTGVVYDVCTHTELSLVHAANPACADVDPATILTLRELYANASAPVVNFTAGVDYAGFEPVALTSATGEVIGGALGDSEMVIGWVRDELSEAPLVTDPGHADYDLADHWPWRDLAGQTITLDMPAAASSEDWLVEFWDTTTGTRLETIDADQDDVTGDITFTLRDFQGSLGFKVYPVGPLTVVVNVTPDRANNRIQFNNRPLHVAIMSVVTGAGYPDDFIASSVVVSSIQFGPGLAAPVANLQHDVDGDGNLDLLLRFNKAATQLPCGWSEPTLTGATATGRLITGSAVVRVVGCPP